LPSSYSARTLRVIPDLLQHDVRRPDIPARQGQHPRHHHQTLPRLRHGVPHNPRLRSLRPRDRPRLRGLLRRRRPHECKGPRVVPLRHQRPPPHDRDAAPPRRRRRGPPATRSPGLGTPRGAEAGLVQGRRQRLRLPRPRWRPRRQRPDAERRPLRVRARPDRGARGRGAEPLAHQVPQGRRHLGKWQLGCVQPAGPPVHLQQREQEV
ncbi:hypothetical protein CI238_01661, partial [Colletotrichum incanum]